VVAALVEQLDDLRRRRRSRCTRDKVARLPRMRLWDEVGDEVFVLVPPYGRGTRDEVTLGRSRDEVRDEVVTVPLTDADPSTNTPSSK
jgi:hypothetical protein